MPSSPPAEVLRLSPLVDAAGWARLRAIREHRWAPRWTHYLGDRLTAQDLAEVEGFRRALAETATAAPRPGPPETLLREVRRWRQNVESVRRRVPVGLNLARDWSGIPTTDRSELVADLAGSMPDDVDLTPMIIYTTTGSTGHALDVPSHPRTVASAHVLAERALEKLGVNSDLSAARLACVNVCAQEATFTFASSASVWGGAVFAKVNLHPSQWTSPDHAARFLEDLDPPLLTSDPVALHALLGLTDRLRPRAVLSTATSLHPRLQAELSRRYRCPVLDWYASTETGPIAAGVGGALELLSPDLYVEVVDATGQVVEDGQVGELVVSGGRNPYLPLLRYRTGDRGRLYSRADGCRVLEELEGRPAVPFWTVAGGVVNTLDVARILREHLVFVQQQTVQLPDRSLQLRLSTLEPIGSGPELALRAALERLFGPGHPIRLERVPDLGAGMPGGKVRTFVQLGESPV